MATAAVQVQEDDRLDGPLSRDSAAEEEDDRLDGPQSSAAEEDHLLLAPDEVRHYLDDAGFASVYLKGTEHGMPVMFLQAADGEITEDALNRALESMGTVLREKIDFALCYDLRNMRTPSMRNSSTVINWMNGDELGPLLTQHALITCVMVANSWAGMAISTCTNVIQKLCSASKPVKVVYTEEERDEFLRDAMRQVKAKAAAGDGGEPK